MKQAGIVAGIFALQSLCLIGCGDSSSSSAQGAGRNYCKVVKKDPLVIESVEDGFFSKSSFSFDENLLVETVEFENSAALKEACSIYKSDSDYGTVICNANSIIAVGKAEMTRADYDSLMNEFADDCEHAYEIESSSSATNMSSISLPLSSSSMLNPGNRSARDYCHVLSSKNPLQFEALEGGDVYTLTTIEYKDGVLTQRVEFNRKAALELACENYKKDASYKSVECGTSTVIAMADNLSESDYLNLANGFIDMCKEFNDVEVVPDLESSSSSEALSDENILDWYNVAHYKKDKVVAANASELACDDAVSTASLEGYDVAYEFNIPTDLGRDYFGKNNAYIDDRVAPVTAECGSLVLNGSNGLLIPLNDVFKSNGFVVEVRFMATSEGDISNIFVAEPPGSSVDGWQIRLDGSNVTFHYRDADDDTRDWVVEKVGEITLNEWHVVQVSFYSSESTIPGMSSIALDVTLDEKPSVAALFHGDISDIKYGLGIGYDAMYQGSHERRFFAGKIDYIRYKKVSE